MYFVLDQPCRKAFKELRRRLTTSPIMQPSDWELSFELMCDASDYALGVVLSQRVDRLSHVIAYASHTLDAAHVNYTTTENESSILRSEMSGVENVVAAHLSKIEGPVDSILIRGNFPDEHLMQLHSSHVTPWFADIVNFIIESILPPHASRSEIDKLKSDAKYYVGDDPYLWRFGSDQVIRRWVEAKATRTKDSKVLMDHVRFNIFGRFGMPRAIISDQGSHFCNRSLECLLQKYGVVHRIATAFHP
ncbi:uncharacterized protein LOC114420723 [Glycine soja]|uniref:uncharacterized protein LOC114420723 n=1 Tax=Glycine soja TaxID=3848 RepID=UPI00103BFFEF|nr:uncharacterized protein LOC114420723 [Glycine soja]